MVVTHADEIEKLLSGNGRVDSKLVNGILHITEVQDKKIEVLVQDKQTKQTILLLSKQLQILVKKYPQLKDEIDSKVYLLFQN